MTDNNSSHPAKTSATEQLDGGKIDSTVDELMDDKDRKILSPVSHLPAKRLHQNLKIHEPPLHGG